MTSFSWQSPFISQPHAARTRRFKNGVPPRYVPTSSKPGEPLRLLALGFFHCLNHHHPFEWGWYISAYIYKYKSHLGYFDIAPLFGARTCRLTKEAHKRGSPRNTAPPAICESPLSAPSRISFALSPSSKSTLAPSATYDTRFGSTSDLFIVPLPLRSMTYQYSE